MNIAKWLPIVTEENKRLFINCKQLRQDSDLLILQLLKFLEHIQLQNITHQAQLEKLELIVETLQRIVVRYKSTTFKIDIQPMIAMFKMQQITDIVWKNKLKISYLIQEIITETLFLMSQSFNDLLSLDAKYNLSKKALFSKNNCPPLMYPMRKLSITRILQILAQSRAELCCHRLIDSLLENYKPADGGGGVTNNGDDNSDSSSIEIYRALTRHMTPPIENLTTESVNPQSKPDDNVSTASFISNEENLQAVEILINTEQKLVNNLLNIAKIIVPKMFGADGVKKSKTTGELRISQKVSNKVIEYYEQILWGEVGNYLEHVVLWWGASPLASRPPHSSQHLREWIVQFTPTATIPQVIIGALHSLADALGCHVTSTSWDQHFRNTLVAAYGNNNTSNNNNNNTLNMSIPLNNVAVSSSSETAGKLFADMLHDLVTLSNQCEVTNEWIVGAPVEELPLVEQIPVLHRLDHTIHTTRLWAASETRKLANCWNVDSFFIIIQCDIKACLSELNGLRLDDHTIEIEKGGLDVHVQVCANMREKLVSEVKVNIDKLKLIPQECLDVLAKVCRTLCLANLQMVFPSHKHWRKVSNEIPKTPFSYVATYLDRVLLPVLEATNDHVTNNMILRIMCEAWLDHIYINRIKFTRYGALQLLTDFASVNDWLINCAIITQDVRKHMLRNEVLRRCEGVGRILLRSPGEHIDMDEKVKKSETNEQGQQKANGNNEGNQSESEGEGHERMPAEMYVPNQEQWLELRAIKKKKTLFLPTLCCEVDS
ncbi:coiled-coil domain-containing protein 142 [Chrysoperla carnea]|uniref:coiled-coil domain-containing protein 142 n=1 Tax=Chrysoperla carnea TaxID=189513 RepID=UPI001D088358|nr:coiled-coil domain-containing protein 142 [Chrysoperla carnea]